MDVIKVDHNFNFCDHFRVVEFGQLLCCGTIIANLKSITIFIYIYIYIYINPLDIMIPINY